VTRSNDRFRSEKVCGSLRRWAAAFAFVAFLALSFGGRLSAQDSAGEPAATPSVGTAVPPKPLPIFVTLAAGYGQRSDACALCGSPDNTDSFTGHLSVGKFLGHGIGVGMDASVWKRGRPGPPGAPDSTGVPTSTSLSNMLGNASLSFSYQVWHIYLRGGAGLAWGSQDIETVDEAGAPMVRTATGKGIGYSAGAGITLPLGGPVSIVFFGNWNRGRYDLSAPGGILKKDAGHEYVEVGFGLTLR
jgi:hypothetical protein